MYNISKEQLGAVLGYLAKRPYNEVFQLVGLLQSLKPVEEKDKEDK